MSGSRKANAWVIAGGALALWLGLQVLLHVVGGGWVLEGLVIRVVFGLVVSLGFAVRMGRLTEARWGIMLAVVALFAAKMPWLTELCIVGYFVWASCRLAWERVELSADGDDDGQGAGGSGAAERFFVDVRLWSLLLWWLISGEIAWMAEQMEAVMVPTQVGGELAGVTSQYVFYGLMMFWLMQKLERSGLDVDDFIGRWPGMRLLGEGLLVALVAGFFGIVLSDGILFIIASFNVELADSILKNWARKPPPTDWQLEQFLGIVFFAPLVEELIFRGLVLRRLAVRWGGTVAVVVSSLAFGGLHGATVLGATISGVAKALLYARSRTLVVPITAHLFYNLVAYSLRWYRPEENTLTLANLYEDMELEMFELAFLTPVVAYYCYRHWPRRREAWPLVGEAGIGEKV